MPGGANDEERSEASRYYCDLLRPLFEGRRFILIGGPIAGFRGLAGALRQLGAERPFLLGTSIGTGSVPRPGSTEWRSLDVRADNVIAVMRIYETRLAGLPEQIRDALDRYDPERDARALGLIVLGDLAEVAGRPLYARRRPEWAALEDKAVIDEFWDQVGVERAPSQVVPPEGQALAAAAAELDDGGGTVWSGDAREGANGGGVYVRWVRGEPDARAAREFFRAHCDRVRVMPFLDGIPCSIHALVFPDGVSVFRPVEGVTLRRTDRSELFYAGMNSFWDPPQDDREVLRDLARRTGEALRERVDYRGAFTIDGVLTAVGFRPTELNPRFGAGMGAILASLPELPLALLCLAAAADEPLAFQPARLERVVVAAADAERGGGGWCAIDAALGESELFSLVSEGESYRLAAEGEPPMATLSVGPGDTGGFLRFAPVPGRTPVGPSLAPSVCRAFAWADRELGTGIGPLEPACAVR